MHVSAVLFKANGYGYIFKYVTYSSAIRRNFSFKNIPKNLDSSYKTDLNIWDCLGRETLVT